MDEKTQAELIADIAKRDALIASLQQERAVMRAEIGQMFDQSDVKVDRSQSGLLGMIVDLQARMIDNEEQVKRILLQSDVLGSGLGDDAAAFSIRYRNDTARTDAGKPADPANYVHRLEHIAQSTPFDAAKCAAADPPTTAADAQAAYAAGTLTYAAAYALMWDDADWTPDVGGDAV